MSSGELAPGQATADGPPRGRAARVPTTKHRRGRLTPRQIRGLGSSSPWLIPAQALPDALAAWSGEVVADIGFGTGEAVAELAREEPGRLVLAIDMHTPGIGDVLARLAEEGLGNVRVVDADAREVLELHVPAGTLAGVRTFFPDPWPKKRHHRRRLIQPSFVETVAAAVQPGGFWHLATDWSDYADAICGILEASPRWRGGVIERPSWRPTTRYERRGELAGRAPIDLWWIRVES